MSSTVPFGLKGRKTFSFPRNSARLFWIGAGFLLLFLVAVLDFFTGSEISLSLFYVFPIALIARVGDWKSGLVAAIVSAIIWLSVEILVGTFYSHPAILYWNALVRLSMFLLMAYSIELGRSLEREAFNARIDFVTGALNSRSFHERLGNEIERASRYLHPFTIVYLDVDDFKAVNDRFGHSTGDQVLRTIVNSLKRTLRKTDIVARVGGDEFVLLLPETNPDAANTVVSKAFQNLVDEMKENRWPITFSAGTVTFAQAPASVELVLDMADKTMYNVKASGKNNIYYATHL